MSLVTPLPIGLAQPLVDSLRNDVVVFDPAAAAALYGSRQPVPFDDALRRVLSRVQDLDVSTSRIGSAPGGTSDLASQTAEAGELAGQPVAAAGVRVSV